MRCSLRKKEIAEQVIANNREAVDDYRAGKEQAIGFLIGQLMKETKGKANPKKSLLDKLRN